MRQAEKKDCVSIKCRFLQKQENKGCVHAKSVWRYDPPEIQHYDAPEPPPHNCRTALPTFNVAPDLVWTQPEEAVRQRYI